MQNLPDSATLLLQGGALALVGYFVRHTLTITIPGMTTQFADALRSQQEVFEREMGEFRKYTREFFSERDSPSSRKGGNH